nr:MAG TPA: hypothetical protein [Caudoviricetes sp.]DAZ36873.1 MAG TPA: hypothetical protein [Caudoviricetes sp.]
MFVLFGFNVLIFRLEQMDNIWTTKSPSDKPRH